MKIALLESSELSAASRFLLPGTGLRHCIHLLLVVTMLLAASTPTLRAQTYLQGIGVPTFTTQIPVENGFVNAANGNLHLEIPLGSFPQRGGGTDKVSLMYDSAIWMTSSGTVWSPTNVSSYAGNNVFGGWRLVTSGDPGLISSGWTYYGNCDQNLYYMWKSYSPWIWTGPDGTVHSFAAATVAPATPTICPGTGTPTASAYASDGTGFYISIFNYTSAIVYAPDGTALGAFNTDPNGNQYSYTYTYSPSYDLKLADTLNRKIVEVTGSSGGPYTYAVSNDQGGTSNYVVKLATINVDTNFGQSGVTENSGTIQAISEIDLPDGSKYQFGYDSGTTSGHYGLLTSMILRTGSQISYSWVLQHDASGLPYTWISSRTTPDGVWNYGFNVLNTCTSGQVNCEQQFTVTKPTNDQTVYTIALNGGAWPVQAKYYSGPVSSSNLKATSRRRRHSSTHLNRASIDRCTQHEQIAQRFNRLRLLRQPNIAGYGG